jgi:hypothetical protein
VQVVILSPKLVADHRLAGDPEFQAFVSAPEVSGFARAELPDVGRVLALKQEGKAPLRPARC